MNKQRSLIKSIPEKIFDSLNILVLLSFSFMCVFPFYYVFIYSISDPQRAFAVTFLPVGFTWVNYQTIFKLPGILHSAFISVARTVVGSTITVLTCALFGYILTKEQLPCRKLIYRSLIATMYVSAGLIPFFLTMQIYGLNNTFWIYIIPSAISAFNVVLMKTFFEQLPAGIEESARIDGAGYLTIFTKIILPLSGPIIATIYVFAAVGQWNSYFDNYIFVTDDNLRTLQYTLFLYLRRAEMMTRDLDILRTLAQRPTAQTVRMAITMIVTLPVLFVYPFAQRYFIKGIMIGAIKG